MASCTTGIPLVGLFLRNLWLMGGVVGEWLVVWASCLHVWIEVGLALPSHCFLRQEMSLQITSLFPGV